MIVTLEDSQLSALLKYDMVMVELQMLVIISLKQFSFYQTL